MRNKFATALRSKSNPQNTVPCTELLKSGAFTYQVHWTFFNWPAEYAGYQVCGVYCDSTYIYATTRCDECPIAVFDMQGNFIKSLGCGILKGRVHGIWKDTAGHILFADDGKHVIRCLAPDGTLEKTIGTFGVPSDTGFDESISGHLAYLTVTHRGEPFNKPTRMVRSQNGCYYVSDGYGNAAVHKFDKDLQLLSSWGQPGTEPGQFSIVHSLITDEKNRVFVADRDNDRVQVFDEHGVFLTSIDDLLYPCDVAVDKDHLYVSENDGRISIFSKQLELLAQIGHAGSGLRGHSITVDKDGNLYLGMLHGNYNLIKLELIQGNALSCGN